MGVRGSLAAISAAAAEHGLEHEAVEVVIPDPDRHGMRAREAMPIKMVPMAGPIMSPPSVTVAISVAAAVAVIVAIVVAMAVAVIVAIVVAVAIIAMRFRRSGAEGDSKKAAAARRVVFNIGSVSSLDVPSVWLPSGLDIRSWLPF